MLITILTYTIIGLVIFQALLLLVPPIIVKTTKDNPRLKKHNATAINNPFGVLIAVDQKHYHPVLAQELYECETRKNLFRLVKSIKSPDEARRIEATGQLITVLMMCEMDENLKFSSEMWNRCEFVANNYKQFEFWSQKDVHKLMSEQMYDAENWVEHHLEELGHVMIK